MNGILPRANGANGYKRVDADVASGGGMLRFSWKKFAIGAVLFIGLVWVFGPRERREAVFDEVSSTIRTFFALM